MLWLFVLTVFTSASLVFSIQPIYARNILPLLGGSPAVWNTVVTFFQAVLLLGYGYAHFLTTRLPLRWQLVVHVGVLVAPVFLLPVCLPAGLAVPAGAQPHLWIYGLMAITVGAPFFALSTTAPLMQKWFACAGHARSRNPYFLYVASNTGSLLALLSYPALIEPGLGLREQAAWWMRGYWMLVLLVIVCSVALWRRTTSEPSPTAVDAGVRLEGRTPSPGWPLRGRWLLLAFIPSSLMLGVTTFVSSEVAAIPLMWIVPLALYLLTYIIAFAQRQILGVDKLRRIQILLTIGVAMLVNMQATQPLLPLMAVHLVYFFVTAWLCHAMLAAIKPAPEHLTEFYLWLCVGGVLGGAFNSLAAPLLFSSILEYPIAVALVGFVVWLEKRGGGEPVRHGDWLWPLVMFTVLLLVGLKFSSLPEDEAGLYGVVFGLPALVCFLFSRRPLRYALGVTAFLTAGFFYEIQPGQELYAERSFFGVNRVTLNSKDGYRLLYHGKTLHGMQSLDPTRRDEPLTYYHPSGPAGDIFATFGQKPDARIGLVGLGTGALATYAAAGQEWTYYEIDPVVEAIARDDRYFSYLGNAKAPIAVKIGDARLNLLKADDAGFGMIVLDAYSSDSIPIHLVTREAMKLYLQKLAPGGIIAAHVSNQHLDLEPVFASLAADLGLVALFRDDTAIAQEQMDRGKSPSQWLVLTRSGVDMRPLLARAGWRVMRLDPNSDHRVWTDDYSSIWSVFVWK